jgi:hypothetical protein
MVSLRRKDKISKLWAKANSILFFSNCRGLIECDEERLFYCTDCDAYCLCNSCAKKRNTHGVVSVPCGPVQIWVDVGQRRGHVLKSLYGSRIGQKVAARHEPPRGGALANCHDCTEHIFCNDTVFYNCLRCLNYHLCQKFLDLQIRSNLTHVTKCTGRYSHMIRQYIGCFYTPDSDLETGADPPVSWLRRASDGFCVNKKKNETLFELAKCSFFIQAYLPFSTICEDLDSSCRRRQRPRTPIAQ